MPANFDLPKDFKPGFSGRYKHCETEEYFQILLQYFGIVQEGDTTPLHKWIYAVKSIEGELIDAGLFWWDPSDRPMTNEDVSNNLATWFCSRDLWRMYEEREDARRVTEFQPQTQAVALVNDMFYQNTDVDFVIVHFSKIVDTWRVLLTTDTDDGRLYEVTQAEEQTRVTAYSEVDDYILTNDQVIQSLMD